MLRRRRAPCLRTGRPGAGRDCWPHAATRTAGAWPRLTARLTAPCSMATARSSPARPRPCSRARRGTHVMQEQGGRRWLVAQVGRRAPTWCCSAPATSAPPSCARWRTCRAPSPGSTSATTCFPQHVPENVRIEATDAPEDVVASAPAGASYLVMTHSHALDQRLAEAILARPRGRLVRPDRLAHQAQTIRTPAARARPRCRPHRRDGLSDRPARHHRQGAGGDRRLGIGATVDAVGSGCAG